MGELVPNAQQQFFGPGGVPLVAGWVFMYIPGTTTAKTTWQDPDLTVPNTNPILLDAYGQARIWGTGQYRQVVMDSAHSLVWDQVTEVPGNLTLPNGADIPDQTVLGNVSGGPAQPYPIDRDQLLTLISQGGSGTIFNLVALTSTVRVDLNGTGAQLAWNPTPFTKVSGTSSLVFWLTAPSLVPGATGPSFVELNVGSATTQQLATNNLPGFNNGQTAVNGLLMGLAAGPQAITLFYSRQDGVSWAAVFCPNTSDESYFPATTQVTLIIGELSV